MKDLRIELRFKNNNLYKKIFAKYRYVSEFCREHNLSQIVVGEYLNLKNTPVSKIKHDSAELVKGYQIKKSALRIASALNCEVFDIFPSQLWNVVSKVYSIEVNSQEYFPYNDNIQLMSIDSSLSDTFNIDEIKTVLSTLLPREENIITMRFGLNNQDALTLEEVAQKHGISKERVRQIEAKALRKLRHPEQAKKILKQGHKG